MGIKDYSLIVPIYNLEISQELYGEFKIGDVLYSSVDKLPRIRNRLNIPYPISEYKNKLKHSKIFDESKVYACIRTKREKDSSLAKEYKRLKESIYLLASSQHYHLSRNRKYYFGGPEYKDFIIDGYYLFENNKKGHFYFHSGLQNKIEPYRLDKKFISYSKHHFFHYLIAIINNPAKYKIKQDWYHTLRRAGILAGQSQFAKSLSDAFLFDMIALETLLTRRGDKFPDEIINRLISFFGWYTSENRRPWENLIKRLYDVRCSLVHDGRQMDLCMRDLLNADKLLSNLLECLCRITKTIKSKEDIIAFSEKLKARQTLGMKIVRPKIRFRQDTYSNKRIMEMEKEMHWLWV